MGLIVEIRFRPSGKNSRGNYEMSFGTGHGAAGEWNGRKLTWVIPGRGRISANLEVNHKNGKARIQGTVSPKVSFGRQMAAVLLLPSPTRAPLGSGRPGTSPTIVADEFIVDRCEVNPIKVTKKGADLELRRLTLRTPNGGVNLNIASRISRIGVVASKATELPGNLPSLVAAHYASSSQALGKGLEAATRQIVAEIVRIDGRDFKGDPLDWLEEKLSADAALGEPPEVTSAVEAGEASAAAELAIAPPEALADGRPPRDPPSVLTRPLTPRGAPGGGATAGMPAPTNVQGQKRASRVMQRLVDQYAMSCAIRALKANGYAVQDVSTPARALAAGLVRYPGYDLLARGGRLGDELHVEVKGSTSPAGTVQVSLNEVLTGLTDAKARLLRVTGISVRRSQPGKPRLGGGTWAIRPWPGVAQEIRAAIDELRRHGYNPDELAVWID